MHQARVDLSKIRINRSADPKLPEPVRHSSQARQTRTTDDSILGSLAAGLAAIGDRFTAPRRQFRIP
jgi:hypothetical protein